jgi:DNA-binding MarR family transcriptional regulator
MAGKNAKMLGGVVIIVLLILLVYYLPKSLEQGIPVICIEDGACQHELYLENIIFFIPLFVVVGLIFGLVLAYLYFERKVELPIPSPNKRNAILSLLPPSERKIVEKIAEKNGEVLQSEISRLEGVGKVRAHRIIDKLLRRGILEKEQIGKTNVLKLRKDVLEALKS